MGEWVRQVSAGDARSPGGEKPRACRRIETFMGRRHLAWKEDFLPFCRREKVPNAVAFLEID